MYAICIRSDMRKGKLEPQCLAAPDPKSGLNITKKPKTPVFMRFSVKSKFKIY